MGFLKKQLLDIIQWLDDSQNTLVYMYPMEDQEIQHGAQLTVRPGQAAVFVEKGQIADVFGPGTHKLETANLPVLGDLKGWAFGFKSPFKSDIFFVNTKEFLNNKWGTPSPVWVPDPQFGQVQLRAFGTYTFAITNPSQFIQNISSTNKIYTKDTINEQLKAYIASHLGDALGSLGVTVARIASLYNEISEQMMRDTKQSFEHLGLELRTFSIGNISLPDEIEKALTELTTMTMKGSIGAEQLAKYQTLRQLDIMEKSTENDGLNAMIQGGMGLGMGVHMGNAFAGNMTGLNQMGAQSQGQGQSVAPVLGADVTKAVSSEGRCGKCQAELPPNAKFCMACGEKVEAVLPKNKFCPECGTKMEQTAKFCMECGFKVQ
ncbi:MAG: SPFH domain-containing protein [Cellulosilyticaceae bacterium]